MMTSARARYAGDRFPCEIISHAVWLYYRFPLGLRMVEELLAARGIIVSHETVRQWARKFGQQFANRIRRRLPRTGDKWHLDGVSRTLSRRRRCGAVPSEPLLISSLIGAFCMRMAEHREPYDSRGSRTVLGARGGAIPPRDSPECAANAR